MTNGPLNRKLRMGLVGGGQGSFIGKVHSIAACLDNRAEVVAGAFSSNPERSKASASDYDVSDDRAYGSYTEMFEKESELPEDQRIDFVSVTTPNHTHFEIAKAAVEAGFNVVLRQTNDIRFGAGRRTSGRRRQFRCGFRPDAQLHRLPIGEAGSRNDLERRAWRNPGNSRETTFRAGCEPGWKSRTKSKLLGGLTPARVVRRAASAISQRTPIIWAAT